MLLLLALTYHILKKFPISVVLIYMLPLFLGSIDEGVLNYEGAEEVVDNIEITHNLSQEIPEKEVEEIELNQPVLMVFISEDVPECDFVVSAYHKLYILYERVSRDRC